MSKLQRRLKLSVVGSLLAAVVIFFIPISCSHSEPTEEEILGIGVDTYIYGYPLVTMELTRRVSTNVTKPEGMKAPVGQFANVREYPDATFNAVTAPNADTLYSVAWVDVSKEPWVLSIPDEVGRYYLMPMLDAWTNVFANPGTRTTGTGPQKYAITGPGWKGSLPEGVQEYKSDTALVWILGRTYCTGTVDDYKLVHAIQDKYSLVPLSSYGKEYIAPEGKIDPAIDMKTAVRDQVNTMDAKAYFTLLADLMKENPPRKDDAKIVAKMSRIGIVPGQSYDPSKVDLKILESVPKKALEKITDYKNNSNAGVSVNGWVYRIKNIGTYGTEYLARAYVAAIGLGANLPEDAVYPQSYADEKGKPYDGKNKYILHFEKDQMPPVKGFWSLTMYNRDYFFVANELNRYTLSQRNKFKVNADGSVDLYIQHESPGKGLESNWLPAPEDKFVLMMRLYWPKESDPSILDGSWEVPPVKKS